MVDAYDELASKTPGADATSFATERKLNTMASAPLRVLGCPFGMSEPPRPAGSAMIPAVPPLLPHVVLVVFLATLIRSAVGFGEALVAVPLLALRLPVNV